jgi:hypothetical protein
MRLYSKRKIASKLNCLKYATRAVMGETDRGMLTTAHSRYIDIGMKMLFGGSFIFAPIKRYLAHDINRIACKMISRKALMFSAPPTAIDS